MKNLMIFKSNELGINVRTIKNDDGSISINAEDTARGFGWVDNSKKAISGAPLSKVRWNRMNKYIDEFNYPQVGKGDYIPESLFYLLAMKANNDVARKFQTWLAVEVIPQVRQMGGYIPTNEDDSEEDILAKALVIAQNKIAQKEELLKIKDRNILAQKEIIKEYKPKVEAYDSFIDSNGLIKVSAIAQDYGMSAIELNKLLYKLGIQYKKGDQWFLYAKYKDMGYTKSDYTKIPHRDGTISTKATTKWTPKGRAFIDEILKGIGISSVFINKSYQQIAF